MVRGHFFWTGLVLISVPLIALLLFLPVFSLGYLTANNFGIDRIFDFGIACSPSAWVLTSLYVLGTVGGQFLFGTGAAVAVYFWSKMRWPKIVLAIAVLVIPYAIPSTVAFTLFEFLLSKGSTVQQVFSPSGSPLDGTWSRFAVMIWVAVWQYSPMIFVMVLAAFLSVPRATIDSARIDGASNSYITWEILLPSAAPVIALAITLRVALMLTKVDAPLAFDARSSNDFACLAAVRIYNNIGLQGDVPMGLVLALTVCVAAAVIVGGLISRRYS